MHYSLRHAENSKSRQRHLLRWSNCRRCNNAVHLGREDKEKGGGGKEGKRLRHY